jgi:hypothetical protein
MGWLLWDFWQITVCGKVKACISHVPGITFLPHYQYSIYFPATIPNFQYTFSLSKMFCFSVCFGIYFPAANKVCEFIWKNCSYSRNFVSDETGDAVDVIYVNTVIWSVGCVGVGEAAKFEQLIASQGQERMGIHTTSYNLCICAIKCNLWITRFCV